MKKIRLEDLPSIVGRKATVGLGNACAEPQTLIEGLLAGHDSFDAVEIVGMIHYWTHRLSTSQMDRVFRLKMFWVDRYTDEGLKRGRVDYVPCRYSKLPGLFDGGYIAIDTALISVSPPDAQGQCSLGVSSDYTKAMALNARTVVAEVNTQMPRVHGDNAIAVDKIDFFVETDRSLPQVPTAEPAEVDRRIAENTSELIEDGATIQIGIGRLSAAVLEALCGKKRLGVHSGLLTDGIVDLMEKGAIDNSRKGLLDGRTVGTTMVGTDKLFRFVHDNPEVESHPADFTHSGVTLSKVNKLHAINSAIQVDLSGQVNAETIDGIQVSGVGGHTDFVCGAGLSIGGKSIIVLPSTNSDQSRSRIVSFLDQGASVTSPRHDVDYVVTEYGIAHLKGKTLTERRAALTAVAHPKFRDALEAAGRATGFRS